MLIYLITIFISFFLLHCSFIPKSRYVKFLLVFFSVLMPSLLAAFRDLNIGTDLGVYGLRTFDSAIKAWNVTSPLSFFSEATIEVGYIIINLGVALFSSSYHVLFFVLQFIVLTLVVVGCFLLKDELKQPAFFYLTYLLLNYCFSFNILRQSIAIGIFIIACKFLISRNFWKYAVVIAIGFLFHKSILFMLPLYFIPSLINNYPKIPWNIVVLILGLILYLVFPLLIPLGISVGFLDSKYIRYANSNFSTHKNNLSFYILIFSFSWYALHIAKGKFFHIKRDIYLIGVFSLSAFMLELCGVYNDVASRVSIYIFLLILILMFKVMPPCQLKKIRFNKWLLFLIGFMIIYFLYDALTTGIAETIPYRSKILGL